MRETKRKKGGGGGGAKEATEGETKEATKGGN